MKRAKRQIALTGPGLLLLSASTLVAQPTQASLVQVWESAQRNDPETVKFERQADGSYHFATRRFPFDGELKNLKATIDDERGNPGYVIGSVEVELVGLSDKVRQDYARSYQLWTAGNLFYYDLSAKRWVGARQFREEARGRLRGRPLSFTFWSWAPSLSLFFVLLILLIAIIRAQRRQRQYFELARNGAARAQENLEIAKKTLALGEEDFRFRQGIPAAQEDRMTRATERADKALAIAEDSNRVLKEILEALRK